MASTALSVDGDLPLSRINRLGNAAGRDTVLISLSIILLFLFNTFTRSGNCTAGDLWSQKMIRGSVCLARDDLRGLVTYIHSPTFSILKVDHVDIYNLVKTCYIKL